MSRLDDVADYLLDPSGAGYTSASESEVDTDAEVEVLETRARRVVSRSAREKQLQKAQDSPAPDEGDGKRARGAPAAQKRAVRLTEIGPRMTLRLVKVEEGMCDGKVMWHEFVTKSAGEQKEMEAMWEERRAEREARRKEQKENVERKRKEKKTSRRAKGKDGEGEGEGEGEDGEGVEADEKDWEGYDEDMDYGDDFLKESEDEDEDEDEMEEE